MFQDFSSMMFFQHGVGKTTFGFPKILEVETFMKDMTEASLNFQRNYMSENTLNMIFDRLIKDKRVPVKTYGVSLEAYNEVTPLPQEEFEEEFEWEEGEKAPQQTGTISDEASEYTNHSGGAYGGDTYWDIIGREFGVTKHKHYREQGNTGLSQQLKKAGVEATVLTKEKMDAARAEVKRILGKDYPDTLQGNLQVRNYYQVANADAVYAVAQLADENGRTIKSYLYPTIKGVTGGTNTAVQLGIALNKPVYVWDLGLKSWFEWNGEYFTAMSDTPVLTKNFAGVGSRDIESYSIKDRDGNWVARPQYKGRDVEEAAKQAIRDVYENTFIKEGVEDLFESNPELANQVYEALGFKTKDDNLDKITFEEIDSTTTHDYYTIQYEGNPIGKIDLNNYGYIDGIEIDSKYRNKGLGKSIYRKINTELLQDNLKSDSLNRISEDAKRVWESLIKSGEAIKTSEGYKSIQLQLTQQQKQQSQQKFQEYVNATGKQDIEGFKKFVTQPSTKATQIISANVPQNKVSGVESFGSTVTANDEVIKALGPNAHSIDMIEAGFRTRTTRSESEMAKYALKVGDTIKHFGKSVNGTTKNILAKVTAIHPKGTPGFKGTWVKEGWRASDVNVIDRFKDGAAAIEFEVINASEPTSNIINVKAFRTLGTFSSKVNYAQRGSGAYYALDKPFQEIGSNDPVEEVEVSYDSTKTLDATTEEGQTKFISIKRAATEGKSFTSTKQLNDAVSEAMLQNGYESLIGWIDQDVKSQGRELVIYTEPGQDNQSSLQQDLGILQAELKNYQELQEEAYQNNNNITVALAMPKITPSSAMKETGVKAGVGKDINSALLSTTGVSVSQAAHQIMESEFYEEAGRAPIDEQEIRDMIIDILQMGKQNYINEYNYQNDINSTLAQIQEVEAKIRDHLCAEPHSPSQSRTVNR